MMAAALDTDELSRRVWRSCAVACLCATGALAAHFFLEGAEGWTAAAGAALVFGSSSLPAKQPEFCLRPFSSPSPAVIAQAVQLQEWDDSRGEPAEKHRGGGLSWEVDWHSIQVPELERRSEPTNPPQPHLMRLIHVVVMADAQLELELTQW